MLSWSGLLLTVNLARKSFSKFSRSLEVCGSYLSPRGCEFPPYLELPYDEETPYDEFPYEEEGFPYREPPPVVEFP